MSRLLLALLACLALSACGEPESQPVCDAGTHSTPDPKEGEPCPTNNVGSCLGTSAMLWCDGGKWVHIPCRGPRGCVVESSGDPTCDYRANVDGDACPSWLLGQKVCRTVEVPYNMLTCGAPGVWKPSFCRSCSADAGFTPCN